MLQEVTAGVVAWAVTSFFVNDLNDQRDQRDEKHTEGKELGPCNHTDHPLFSRFGGKEDYPREQGNRLPLLVAPSPDYHSFRQKARTKTAAPSDGGGFSAFYGGYFVGAIQESPAAPKGRENAPLTTCVDQNNHLQVTTSLRGGQSPTWQSVLVPTP